jgi:hypothetical protein
VKNYNFAGEIFLTVAVLFNEKYSEMNEAAKPLLLNFKIENENCKI